MEEGILFGLLIAIIIYTIVYGMGKALPYNNIDYDERGRLRKTRKT